MKLTLSQIAQRTKPRGLVLNYGPSGSGKTRCLYTLIKMGLKGWIFDLDFGADPLLNLCRTHPGFKDEDLTIFRYVPTGGDRVGQTQNRPKEQGKDMFIKFLEDFNLLNDMIDQKTNEWKPNTNPPDWICIDSQSTLNEIALDFVLALRGHNLGDQGTHGMQEYGFQMGKLQEIIKSAQTFPCLVVFNYHEKYVYKTLYHEKGEAERVLEGIEPLITGQMSSSIGKDFSVVIHSQSPDGKKFTWLTRPNGLFKTAKTRFKEGLPQEIEQDYKLIL